MPEHWFWLLLVAACLLWYATITVLVAIQGVRDIRRMLERLTKLRPEVQAETTAGAGRKKAAGDIPGAARPQPASPPSTRPDQTDPG